MPEEILDQMKPLGYVFSTGRVLCAKHAASTHDPYVKSGQAIPIWSDTATDTDLECSAINCGIILAKNSTDPSNTRPQQTSVNNKLSQRKDNKTMPSADPQQRPSLMGQISQRFGRYHHSLASSPVICFVIAGACGFFGTCATLVDIRTTENLAMGIPGGTAGIMWGVLLQPWQLLTGAIPSDAQLAYLYAWGVELLQLIFALALVIAVNKLSSVNTVIARWFVVIGALLIILNGYANFQSAPTANPLIQVLMAVLVGGLAVVGLPLAIGFAEHGFSEL